MRSKRFAAAPRQNEGGGGHERPCLPLSARDSDFHLTLVLDHSASSRSIPPACLRGGTAEKRNTASACRLAAACMRKGEREESGGGRLPGETGLPGWNYLQEYVLVYPP
jgi:hypothetical protein